MNLSLHKTKEIILDYIRSRFFIINYAHVEKKFVPYKEKYFISEVISSQPKVSVIITNFNYGVYLEQAIDSALNQTYTNKEIIVVDDGSTDNSHEIIDNYKQRIIIIKQENKGQAAAFNAGFNASKGEILCFLDADDHWDKNKLYEVVNKFQENQWGIVFHDLKIESSSGQSNVHQFYSEILNNSIYEGIYFPDFLQRESLFIFSPTSGMSVLKTIAKQFFPLHEDGWKFCADLQLAFCCACLTSLGYINKSLGTYRLHDKNNYFSFKRRKPINTEIRDLINMMLCHIKFLNLKINDQVMVSSIFDNYRFTRRWLFMTSKINFKLLFYLWKRNINYYKQNGHVHNPNIAMIKFIIFDTIILCLLFFRIPSRRLTIRNTYINQFSKEYNKLLSDFALLQNI